MDGLTGITWLDWLMAVLTVGGLALTWRQARRATKAAEAAKDAVATTRSYLMTMDMVNDFRQVREWINEVTRAVDEEDLPISKHVLVQLSESLHRACALAREEDTASVPIDVIDDMTAAAVLASDIKATLARSKAPKLQTSTRQLMPLLTRLKASLLQFETVQKYATPETTR